MTRLPGAAWIQTDLYLMFVSFVFLCVCFVLLLFGGFWFVDAFWKNELE